MPVPTDIAPKHSSESPVTTSEAHPNMEPRVSSENVLLPPQKENMILVHVNPGETFTIQAEHTRQCIPGPAEVPMISPNGAIPPIQVPQGYISQVIEDNHGFRRVVVLRENQSTQFPGGVGPQRPVVHPSSPVPQISMQPGACYNYMQQSGVPGSQPIYPANHISFQPQARFSRPEGFSTGDRSSMDSMHRSSPNSGQPHSLMQARPSQSSPFPSKSPNSSPETVRAVEALMTPYRESPKHERHHHWRSPVRSMDNEKQGAMPFSSSNNLKGGSNANDFQGYSSSAANSESASAKDAKVDLKTILSSVSKPEVTNICTRTASLHWSLQYSAPQDIKIYYEIQMMTKSKDGSKFKPYQRVEDTKAELSDLKPGVEYHIKVAAEVNSLRGEFSKVTTFRTKSCQPSTPAAPKSGNQSKNSLNLRWNAPNDNGEKIIKYNLEWDEGEKGSGFRSLYSGPQKHFKVDKLRPSTCYTFRLSCENTIGSSPWSPEVTYCTQGAAPAVPESPELVKAGVDIISLKWGRCHDTRGGILGYTSDTKFTLEMDDGSGYGYMAVYDGFDRSMTLKNLSKCSPYNFRIRAYNDNGKSGPSATSCFLTLPDKPSPPGKVMLKGKAHSSWFKVMWDEPADNGGSEVQEYILECSLEKGQQMVQIFRGKEREFTLTNCQPGLTYRLRARCVSEGGVSMPSEVSYVPVPPVIPGQCNPPWASAKSTASIVHLQWGPPQYNGGSEVTQYELGVLQLNVDTNEEHIVTVYKGNKNSYSVANLKPGSSYQFAVRAGNKAGMGGWSECAVLMTGAAAPEKPDGLQADGVTSKSVQLSWKEPHHNGSPIIKYSVEYGGTDSGMNSAETTSSLSCNILHLHPNHFYYFHVQAENSAGKSAFSEVLSVKTSPACPGCIPRVWQDEIVSDEVEPDESGDEEDEETYSQPISSTAALVRWQRPADNGSEITGYIMELSSGKSSREKSRSWTIEIDDNLFHVVHQLNPDSEYRVRVRAANAIGVGQFSSAIIIRTQPLPPRPPVIECLPSSTSLKLKWTDNANDNDYNLQILDRHGRFVSIYTGPSKTYKVMKLDEKARYLFRINAKNEAGEGPFSEPYSFSTTISAPSVIRNPPCVTLRVDEAMVTWDSIGDIKGDQVSYVVNIKDSQSTGIRQIFTEDYSLEMPDLVPGVEYSLQVAVVRHAKVIVKNTGDQSVKKPQEPTGSDNEEGSHDDQEISEEVTYENITGPFTNWVSFKVKIPEKQVDTPTTEASSEVERNGPVIFQQIWQLLNEERMKPVLLMMNFFIFAFIFAYLVQFLLD